MLAAQIGRAAVTPPTSCSKAIRLAIFHHGGPLDIHDHPVRAALLPGHDAHIAQPPCSASSPSPPSPTAFKTLAQPRLQTASDKSSCTSGFRQR